MKKILFLLLFPVLVLGQSKNQNFVKTRTYTKESTSGSLLSTDTIINISYYDGLGRTIQTIASKGGGSGQDIVTPFVYDDYNGRQTKQYLPYANSSTSANSPNLRDNYTLIAAQKSRYKSLYPSDLLSTDPVTYSEIVVEKSPLARVLEQAAPGDVWAKNSGHTIKKEYDRNVSTDQVYNFRVRFINNNTEQPEIYLASTLRSSSQYYSASYLYKTIMKDENWVASDGVNRTTVEFTDKNGRVILNRKYNDGIAHDTYYVYDDYGNLTFVITPQAFANTNFITTVFDGFSTNFTIDQSIINNLCYTYKYDSDNRVVEKLTAGKVVKFYEENAEYIVYDKLDRPVFTQSGNQRSANKWLFTKYDKFGRIVYTGECVIPMDRVTLQNNVNAATVIWENKTPTSTFIANGGVIYYTKDAYASIIGSIELFTVNYYDNYTFTRTGITIPTATDYSTPISAALKSLPTGTMVRILGTSIWKTTAMCYDAKGRIVWSKTSQPHYNTYTTFQAKLNFIGQAIETKQNHIRSTVGAIDYQNIEIIDTYSYGFGNRLTNHLQKINNPAYAQRIASYNYNELGQNVSKGVGGLYDSSPAQQTIDYKYNIRGWLTKINEVTSLGSDLFAETINYNQPTSGTALYNGNVSQVSWKNMSDNQLKNYTYTYDALNRIKSGIFTNSTVPAQNNNFNLTGVTYDRNGNITFLQRNGVTGQTDMDKMTYLYNGNVLQRISEAGIQGSGFVTTIPTTNTSVQYTYDANGNLIKDNNKNITSITYNHLNLPMRVTFSNGNYLEYMYSADGVKIKKTHFSGSTTTAKITEYNNGFVYEKVGTAFATLGYIPTEEGYAYKNADGVTFNYAVQLKDHLGNVRLSFTDANNDRIIAASEILEANDYEPFGMEFGNSTVMPGGNATAQKLGYNDREYEQAVGYNMNEMDWRHYDPAIGRFNCIDKFAEISYSMSPYVFSNNNPIIFTDPSGLTPSDYDWDAHDAGRTGVYASGSLDAALKNVDPTDVLSFNADVDPIESIWKSMYESLFGGTRVGGGNPFSNLWNWITGKETYTRTVTVDGFMSDEEVKAAIAQEDAADAIVNASQASGEPSISPAGPIMILMGQKLVPKVGGIGGGGAAGAWTSVASKALRTSDRVVQQALGTSYKLPFRVLGTRGIGAAAGRLVPYAGWVMLSYDLGSVFGPSKWYGSNDSKWFE